MSWSGSANLHQVLSFPPAMAPTKVLIVPLSSNKEFTPHVASLSRQLRAAHIACRVDDSSATIGKRYSRNDELGTPFGVTVDFQTIADGTVTLRERDTMKQVRADVPTIIGAIHSIIIGDKSWEQVYKDLPVFDGQELGN